MNDPHVESLSYTLIPGADTSYREDAEPVSIQTSEFSGHLEGGTLTITMTQHHAREDSACALVDPYLRAWETVAALESGRSEFTFEFAGSHIIDRQPDTNEAGGTVHAVAVSDVIRITSSVNAHVTRGSYPEPPSRLFAVAPAVDMLVARWRLAADGRDTLLAAAYFCLTAIEFFYGKGNRSRAAASLGVSANVLQTLGRLTAGGGDPTIARTFDPAASPLSPEETTWIERTIRELILRAGEVAARGGASTLSQLTLAHLPPLQ